jgi:hypothetical protein
MSKVVSMIRASDTGRWSLKKERLSKIMNIHENVETTLETKFNTEYRIDVRLGAKAIVAAYDDDHLKYAIKDTKRTVVEYIFGEFRPYFRELSMALWDEDFPAAMEIMTRFEKQMFEEDSFE